MVFVIFVCVKNVVCSFVVVRENEQFSHKIEDGRDDILERKIKIDIG